MNPASFIHSQQQKNNNNPLSLSLVFHQPESLSDSHLLCSHHLSGPPLPLWAEIAKRKVGNTLMRLKTLTGTQTSRTRWSHTWMYLPERHPAITRNKTIYRAEVDYNSGEEREFSRPPGLIWYTTVIMHKTAPRFLMNNYPHVAGEPLHLHLGDEPIDPAVDTATQ